MGFLNADTKVTVMTALGLLLTDRFLAPMIATSELGYLLTYFLQAWIFLKIKDRNAPHYSPPAAGGMGAGPVLGIY